MKGINIAHRTGPLVSRTAPPPEMLTLHVGFLLTGAYTTLLGTALPLLTARWHLQDSRAGMLFLAQFLGSMTGAFLRGRLLSRMIALGFATIAVCACLLAIVPAVAAPLVLYLYGCGLGTAMTSTSVRVGQMTGHRSGSALASLNAVWAAGAGLAPWLLLTRIEHSLTALLCWMALPAALLAGASAAAGSAEARPAEAEPSGERTAGKRPAAMSAQPALPVSAALLLVFLSFGAVGVETGLGGWMTTYIGRAGLTRAISASAASCFWFGLLASRVVLSFVLTFRASAINLLLVVLAVTTAATVLLLCLATPGWLVAVALLCGCGVGPLYPLVLSRGLALLRGRAIFAAAGLGAALVPLLTGLLSGRAGSLRIGLLVPLAILFLMFVLLLMGRTALEERPSE